MDKDALPLLDALLAARGFAAAAVTPARGDDLAPAARALREEKEALFTARGQEGAFGDMDYLTRYGGLHYHPERVLPWARSLVLVAMPVWQDLPPDREEGRRDLARGLVARYAWGRDYHKVMGSALKDLCARAGEAFPGSTWKPWVDAHPLDEVFFAVEAGLGWRGRHGLCIVPGLGTWHALGLVATDLALPAGPFRRVPENGSAALSCPQGCRACVKACPAGALQETPEGWRADPALCVSYLSMELKGDIPDTSWAAMGRRVFGCDACQEACPMGKSPLPTREPGFMEHRAGSSLAIADLLSLKDHEDCTDRFAGSPLMRAGRDALVRNACVAAAAGGCRELLPRLRELSGEPGLAGRHARKACRILGDPNDPGDRSEGETHGN